MARPSPELLALITGETLVTDPRSSHPLADTTSRRRRESTDSDSPEAAAMRAARAVIQNEREQTFGYSNNFHSTLSSAEQDGNAASAMGKALAARSKFFPPIAIPHPSTDILPSYDCTVHLEGHLALRRELASPFIESSTTAWVPVYAILHGTALHLYRHKPGHRVKPNLDPEGPANPKIASSLSDEDRPEAGALLRTFSLQHAELGLALDHQAVVPPPCSSLVKMQLLFAPAARCASIMSQQYREHPERFEPKRDHVFRVRAEAEQFLLSANSEMEMLTWVEMLCRSVDIALPLEGRSEPRARTLPRRGRRMRLLEGDVEAVAAAAARGSGASGFGRRLVEQQERLFREMYPHLARSASGRTEAAAAEPEDAVPTAEGDTHREADPDTEDLDASDVRPASPTNPATAEESSSSEAQQSSDSATPMTSQHPSVTSLPSSPTSATFPTSTTDTPPSKPSTRKDSRPDNPNPTPSARYLRRCAPILFADSPRACNVLLYRGRRMKVNSRRGCLEIWEPSPLKGTRATEAEAIVGELPPSYDLLYGDGPAPKPPTPSQPDDAAAIAPEPEREGSSRQGSTILDAADEIVPLRAVASEASAKIGLFGKGKARLAPATGATAGKDDRQLRKHAKAEARKARKAKQMDQLRDYTAMGSMGYGVVG